MTPHQDNVIRAKATRYMAWAEAELERTGLMVEYPEKMDYTKSGNEWRVEMEKHFERRKVWEQLPHIKEIRDYRSSLYDLIAFCRHRRKHPVARLLAKTHHIGPRYYPKYSEAEMIARFGKKYEESPLTLPAVREPTYAFRWWWHRDSEEEPYRTEARTWSWGDTVALGLPRLAHAGRAYFHMNHDKWEASVEWSLGPHRGYNAYGFAIGLTIEEDRDVMFNLTLPVIGAVYVKVKHAVPVSWTFPKVITFTAADPITREPETRSYTRGSEVDVFEFRLDGNSVSGALFSVGEPMQSDGKRRFYYFWPDKLFGRAEHTCEKIGPEVEAIACLPERQYTLKLQREISTWKRPRWPWVFWRKYVDISAVRPPEFAGKGENSWDCGPDAIYGMSSPGHSYEAAVAAYVKEVLVNRARRGTLEPEHRTIITPVEETI